METAGFSRKFCTEFRYCTASSWRPVSIHINIIILTKLRSMLYYLKYPYFEQWFYVSFASCGQRFVTPDGEGSWTKLWRCFCCKKSVRTGSCVMGGGSSKKRWPVSDVVTSTKCPWQRWYKDLNITRGCILHVQGMSVGCFQILCQLMSASNRSNKAIDVNIQPGPIIGPQCSLKVCGDALFIRLLVQFDIFTFLFWCKWNKAIACI
jgi:hypothetical protein